MGPVQPQTGRGGGGGGGEDLVTLVNDIIEAVEDTPIVFDLFANDEPEGEWEVLDFRVPSPEVGGAPTQHFPSAAVVIIAGAGTIVLTAAGTGTLTPALNFNGAMPILTIVARGPDGLVRCSTLAITVSAVNDPPTARDVVGVSIEGAPAVVNLGGAITDPDGLAVTITHIDATPLVFDTPIEIEGGTITVDADTLFATITPDVDRTDPVTATYTASDGTLTSIGDISVIIAEIQNRPMISPVAPNNPGNVHDAARVAFSEPFLQEYGPLWPNIGPPDEEGHPTVVTVPPYSAGQGYYDLVNKEPWLYNRVRGAYLLWEATQDEAVRDVAIRWAELYMAAVVIGAGNRGTFTIIGNTGGDPQDVKYLYAEIGLLYQRLTGATVYYPQAMALFNQTLVSYPAEYDASSAELWTERHTAYALRNCMVAFYVSGGDPAILAEATNYVELVLEMSEESGAPLHQKNKHEGDADTTDITSPWMSAILVEDMLQYYRHTRNTDVLDWIDNYGVFVVDHGLYVADHTEEPEFAGLEGLRIPAYLFGTMTQYPEGTAADMRHSRDTGALLDKAIWAGTVRGYDTTELETARDELLEAALVDDAYWTRATPLYPRRRINPARSWCWLFAHFYALVYDTGFAPPIPPVVLTSGVIAGSTQQGATLMFTRGTERGTPTPDVHWVWQLAGVDIAGTEDDLTFETVDVGATRVHVTISNEAGTVEYNTNVITVVPAGAPEVTVQPTAQAALEGEQAVFSCSFTGIPDPTAVVQLDTGGGFATTGTGTLDHDTVDDVVTATWTSPVLDAGDDGTVVRFQGDNGVGSPVNSEEVGLSIISEQPAVRLVGSTANVTINESAGGAGFLNFTWCGWLYMETWANHAQVLSVEGVADRTAFLIEQDTSHELTIGDSNTGAGMGWATPPPAGAWLWVTFRGPAAHPGLFTATYREQGQATTYTMTRANGIEDSVPIVDFLIGGGAGAGSTVRAQHMRAFNTRLTDQQCIDEQFNYDPTAGSPVFFAVAQDDGGGGVEVIDASGNGADIVLTNALLSTEGPLTGSVS